MPPVKRPLPTDQVNLTDEQSRIMPIPGGGFEQCYNAPAVVAAGSLLLVVADVIQAPNDKQQLQPMLEQMSVLPETLGKRRGARPVCCWPTTGISAKPTCKPARRRGSIR